MAGDFVTWDPSLLQQPDAAVYWNRGCPPGYFAEFVSPTFVAPDGTRPTDYGNPASRVICRAVATTTPDTIVDETGATWQDALDNFNAAVQQTLTQVSGSILGGVGATLPLLLLGVLVIMVLNAKQR